MILPSPLSRWSKTDLGKHDYVVFGGTFDPIHAGHLTVVDTLSALFPKVIVAPTLHNPWKAESPLSLEQRISMCETVLRAENYQLRGELAAGGICVSSLPYVYAYDLANCLRRRLSGRLFWAVGEDSVDSVSGWKNWSQQDVPILVAPIKLSIHASDLRENPDQIHPAIRDYATKNSFYGGK